MPTKPPRSKPRKAKDPPSEAPPGPLRRAEDHYSEDERIRLAQFLGISEHEPGYVALLSVAADLHLNPLHGEIWLAEGRQWDSTRSEWVTAYRPAVGRDGLLKHAREQKAYKGLRFNVVCANDTFEVNDDGWDTQVLHRFASLGPTAEKGHKSRWRGDVVGAWAKLYFQDDRPPLFYFAPLHEHVRVGEKVINGGERVEELIEAWKYLSAMIAKSAQSYVLRVGFGVTGVIPFDELRVDDPQLTGDFGGGSGPKADLDEDPNPPNAEFIVGLEQLPKTLRAELVAALEEVNKLAPFSWTPAKVRMRLGSDCDEEKARAVLAEVEAEFKALRDRGTTRQSSAAATAKG